MQKPLLFEVHPSNLLRSSLMLAKINTSYQFLLSNLILKFSRFPFPTQFQVPGNSVHSLSLLNVKCSTEPYVAVRIRRNAVVVAITRRSYGPNDVTGATTENAVARRVGLHCPFPNISC